MYVDALYRIAVQRWPQVYAYRLLVQQFGLDPAREAADFESWLKALADGGSDLYLTTGAPQRQVRW